MKSKKLSRQPAALLRGLRRLLIFGLLGLAGAGQVFVANTAKLARKKLITISELSLTCLNCGRFAAAASLLTTFGLAQAAQGYAVTLLSDVVLGNMSAYDINDRGQVVGSLGLGSARWENGIHTRLGSCAGIAYAINQQGDAVGHDCNKVIKWGIDGTVTELGNGSASAINSLGHVVGWRDNYDFGLYANGGWQSLSAPQGHKALPYDISDIGLIVGAVSPSLYSEEGRLPAAWIQGSLMMLEVPETGGHIKWGMASRVNNLGTAIAGSACSRQSSFDSAACRGVVWANGSAQLLEGFGGTAYDVNNIGHAVGSFVGIGNSGVPVSRAALWTTDDASWGRSQSVDLNVYLDSSQISDGWELNYATAVNNNGWITADAYSHRFGYAGAVLIPVPSAPVPVPTPKSDVLVVTALSLLLALRHKKVVACGVWP